MNSFKPQPMKAQREGEQTPLVKTNQQAADALTSYCYILSSCCYTDPLPAKVISTDKNYLSVDDSSRPIQERKEEKISQKVAVEKSSTVDPSLKKPEKLENLNEHKAVVRTGKEINIGKLLNGILAKLKLKPASKDQLESNLKKILISHRLLDSNISTEKTMDKLLDKLVNAVQNYLKEEIDIAEGKQQAIFNSWIDAAILDGLADTNQLPEPEKTIYQAADFIQKKLEQLRNRPKKSKKKPPIERLLILESLLDHPSKQKILSNIRLIFSKEIKSRDNVELIDTIAEKLVKDPNCEGLTRDILKQNKYKATIQKIIDNCLPPNNSDKYQFLQDTSLFMTRDNSKEIKELSENESKLSTKQQLFVTHFIQEFEKFYCMYRAIDFSLVRRREASIDQGAKIAERYEHATVNVEGYHIPFGIVGSFFAKLLVAREDRNIEKAAARIGWIFGSRLMEENARYIRFAAEYIAYRHQMQIELLTTTSIQVVGECAADRAIQFIIASDDNLIVAQQSFLSRLWEGMKQTVTYKKYAPMLLPEFKGPISAIIDGVIEGKSREKDRAKSVSTIEGHTWAPGGIFRNVGFMVKDERGRISLYRHPNLVTFSDTNIDPKKHGALVYGYCWLRPEELELAIQHGYIKDEKTSLEDVFKRFPKPSSPLLVTVPGSNPMLNKC